MFDLSFLNLQLHILYSIHFQQIYIKEYYIMALVLQIYLLEENYFVFLNF